ncbi:ATP-binding protein [Streptomyces sp. NPDC048718]|uniref:ATP-binding protein n=1 Tax=Streptomyces sp. NPDC048718 TaxID=3365587 RepID=UPI003720F8CF
MHTSPSTTPHDHDPARTPVAPAAPAALPGYTTAYPARDTAPAQARRDVAAALTAWGLDQLADTARLLVSELVTNVVTHTHSRQVTVAVTRATETTVRITVLDTDRSKPAVPQPASFQREFGRGLLLVDALADHWAVEYVATGKRIWCQLSTSTPGTT